MIGGRVARHAIVVVRAPLVDDGRGNLAADWDAATETPSEGWAVDVGASGEDSVNRDGASIEYTIRGPLDADLRHTDRVRLLGGLFVVDGAVGRQPGISPATSHSVARLVVWEG